MFNDNKKKIAALIIAKSKSPSSKPSAPAAPEHEAEPSNLEAMARELLDAIKSDDAAAFAQVFKSMCECCDDDSEQEGAEEEPSDSEE